MLAADEGQLEERARCPGESVRTARQEIDLTAVSTDPRLDAGQPDTNTFPLELLPDLSGPKFSAAL
jgi:hypothetical protein